MKMEVTIVTEKQTEYGTNRIDRTDIEFNHRLVPEVSEDNARRITGHLGTCYGLLFILTSDMIAEINEGDGTQIYNFYATYDLDANDIELSVEVSFNNGKTLYYNNLPLTDSEKKTLIEKMREHAVYYNGLTIEEHYERETSK